MRHLGNCSNLKGKSIGVREQTDEYFMYQTSKFDFQQESHLFFVLSQIDVKGSFYADCYENLMKVIHVLHFYTAGALAAILLRHSFLPAYFLTIMKFLYRRSTVG